MTAYPLGVEVSCDGPDEQTDCPDSAAIPIRFGSMTAQEVRADGRQDGWTRRRRSGRLADLCPGCTPARP
jgi:hypothetical protein